MFRTRFPLVTAFTLLWATLGISDVNAEMGKAPAGASGFYMSAFGGYVYQDAPATQGYVTNMAPTLISTQDGGFVGADLGFILGPDVSPFGLDNARIETTFSTNIMSDDKASAFRPLAALSSVTGFTEIAVNSTATNRQETEIFEGSVALKGEVASGQVVDLTSAFEVFIRSQEDKTLSTTLSGLTQRSSDVDGLYIGALVALQPEFDLGAGLSFVGDFGVGFYVVDARGTIQSSFGPVTRVSDKRTDLGFRGRLGGALKAQLAGGVTASLFGTVDYWSDTPVVAPQVFMVPANLALEGLTEAKAGARLTIALGGN